MNMLLNYLPYLITPVILLLYLGYLKKLEYISSNFAENMNISSEPSDLNTLTISVKNIREEKRNKSNAFHEMKTKMYVLSVIVFLIIFALIIFCNNATLTLLSSGTLLLLHSTLFFYMRSTKELDWLKPIHITIVAISAFMLLSLTY